MKLRGKVHKFGADIDTDVILPGRYLNLSDPQELARHIMEGLEPEFHRRFSPGDIIVATTNFGCGSSREHAPLALKAAGVACIIASSFARIFFRNAINLGLPLLECEAAAEEAETGDIVEVELKEGSIYNISKDRRYQARPYPDFLLRIMDLGGLIEYTRRRLSGEA